MLVIIGADEYGEKDVLAITAILCSHNRFCSIVKPAP
jgi:hypothetical protein